MMTAFNSVRNGASVGWRRRGSLLVAALCLVGFGSFGCKDKKQCDEAVETTRKALQVEDSTLARQWRDRTWKMCGDAAQLAALDKEILAREEELANRVVEAAKQARELAQSKVDEIQRLWRGVDKLDAFKAEGNKFEKDKVEAEIKNAHAEGKRLLRGLDPVYEQQLQKYHSKHYKLRLAAVEAKVSGKK